MFSGCQQIHFHIMGRKGGFLVLQLVLRRQLQSCQYPTPTEIQSFHTVPNPNLYSIYLTKDSMEQWSGKQRLDQRFPCTWAWKGSPHNLPKIYKAYLQWCQTLIHIEIVEQLYRVNDVYLCLVVFPSCTLISCSHLNINILSHASCKKV